MTDHRAETINRIVNAVKSWREENGTERVRFRLATGNVGVMAATNEEVSAAHFPSRSSSPRALVGSFRAGASVACRSASRISSVSMRARTLFFAAPYRFTQRTAGSLSELKTSTACCPDRILS